MDKTETGTIPDSTINSLKNSLGTTNIFNPESQLLNGMIKDNDIYNRKKSSISISSFILDSNNPEHDINDDIYNYPFHNKDDELSTEFGKEFLFESDKESNSEDENDRIINELLNYKRNSNQKTLESAISELDTQSSNFTDTETQTETQSEYSIDSSRLDTEPLKNRIWYYKQTSDINNKQNFPIDDNQYYSDDSSIMDDSTAAIRQLKLHHYVSTNNLKVNKKDNKPMIKRRTTIASSKFRPNLNNRNLDFIYDSNDIPLFSNKEFKTDVKESYILKDSSVNDYNTSLLLTKTGDASKKRRSQIASQRTRPYSNAIVNDNYTTISPPLSPNSFKLYSSTSNTNTFSNLSNKKQPQLNNPMEADRSAHIILKSENLNSNKNIDTQSTTNTPISSTHPSEDNNNQIYKVLMMAKGLFSLGGKPKKSDSISTSRRSSIRKHPKKNKRHNTHRHRYSLRSNGRKNSISQNISLQELSEDDMTTFSGTTDADFNKSNHNTETLKKKASNADQLKRVNRKTSELTLSRNSSLMSASTRRSSLYSKNKFYQNDYSTSNLSDSTGIELDDGKKYEESFDLYLQNNSKNDKPRVYGVFTDSYYGEYHEPIVSSVDGRSSVYDYDDDESVISESDNGALSSYTNAGDPFNDIFDIRNKLSMQPLNKSIESPMIKDKNTNSNSDAHINNTNTIDNSVRRDLKSKSKKSIETIKKIIEDRKTSSLKKPHSSSTIETNISTESLTPTITNANANNLSSQTHQENGDDKSEITVRRSTMAGSNNGDNKSTTTASNTTAVPRLNHNNYDMMSNIFMKRHWDDDSNSTYSHLNDSEQRRPLEIASMPEGVRESVNYPTIKQIPLPYYRYGVYMYITDPIIVQTRTMMERMFSAHTLYTITVKLLRPNLPLYRNDNVCTFTVHKRYRQFRSFYKELHKKYKDTINDWPEFPKKTFFDRFDADTIKNRAFAFSSLMSFISLHPLLYNCPVLLTFLEITGSMNNPLSNINSNISKQNNLGIKKMGLPIEGKTIQFEGRNVAPSIPKIFGSLGRRQYPPGFYGQFPQSNFDPTSFPTTSSNTSHPNHSLNNNNPLQRRSMYGKLENINYFTQDFYSSFSRPHLSKMSTTEFLKNRNSLYSNLSASEIERYKNDPEASSSKSMVTEGNQATPKLTPIELKNINTPTTTETTTSNTTSLLPTPNKTNTHPTPQNRVPSQSHLSHPKLTSSVASPSSSNTPTPKLSHHTPTIDPSATPILSSEPPTDTKDLTESTEGVMITSDVSLNTSQSHHPSEIPERDTNHDQSQRTKLHDKPASSPSKANETLNQVSSLTSPPSPSTSSSKKGKNVSNEENVSENSKNVEKIDPSSPVIPRLRPRTRNPMVYRTADEMDLNCMPVSRYNHYQQIKEIPGFQYLISEFPKLRSNQNKRYSSIF